MAITENEYGFSLSIDASSGVDKWLGDGAQLNHYGDWIRLKGRPEIGSTFSIQHNYESGNFNQMPEDIQISLQPGETVTINNREEHGKFEDVQFNVLVKYIGPAPAYQEPENGNGNGAVAGPPVLFPRLRAFIDSLRGGQ